MFFCVPTSEYVTKIIRVGAREKLKTGGTIPIYDSDNFICNSPFYIHKRDEKITTTRQKKIDKILYSIAKLELKNSQRKKKNEKPCSELSKQALSIQQQNTHTNTYASMLNSYDAAAMH